LNIGLFQGVTDDKNHDLNASHIGDLLEAHGKTWKNYAEGDPGPCYQQEKSGSYVRKHVPFISFVSVQNSPARCAKIVPATQLAKDIQDGTLPDFSFYSPDLKNDGHDTGIAYADKALKSTFEPLLNNPKFMKDMLLVVTFDEDDRHEGNKIFTALIGESVIPGAQDNSRYDHYSLLRTVEDLLDIGTLHQHDEHAVPITGVWVP
jgi:Phosphoesterase family